MNKAKTREIIKFSFFKDIRNKWFIIFNIITLVSVLIMLNFTSISSLFKSKENATFDIEVLDNENLIFDTFKNSILDTEHNFSVSKIFENDYTSENISDDLIVIEVNFDEENLVNFRIISKEGIESSKYNAIKDALQTSRNRLFSQKYSISENELNIFQSELNIERLMLGVDAKNSTTKDYIKLFSAAFTYIIAILIFSKISSEISQEKQSKSSEYILTTVSEKEYLFAKIFSNVAIVVIQGILLLIYYYIGALIANVFNISSTDISLSTSSLNTAINSEIIYYAFALIIYNILNIIFLCIIQATLAAKTASSSEAGNTTSLTSFIMLAAYIIATVVITPYSKVNLLIKIISCLPILSAYFIPALMVIGQIETWQIIISLLLLIVSIPVTFNICSKLFKNGILDYTKFKKKKEITQNETLEKTIEKRKIKNLAFVIGLAIILYIGIQTILSLILTFALPSIFGNYFSSTDITLINQIILQVFSLGITSLFVLSYCNHREKSSQETHKITLAQKSKIILIALFLVFVLQIFLSYTLYPELGLDYDVTDMFEVSENSSVLTKLILIISLAITPAIFEELFFRKAIIDFTLPYGKKFALVFSALLFGIIHMNLSQGLFAFIMGLIMGAIYIYTGDLKLTVLIHFLNNGYAAFVMVASDSSALLLTFALLIALVIGAIQLIKLIAKKDFREKLKTSLYTDISKNSFEKYKYLFTDFTFCVSAILIILMSILTEKLLR